MFQKLSRWCIENKLTISMEKTNFVLFHTPNKPFVRNYLIATENIVINHVDAVKYLGITIDEKLTWNAHVEYVCNSLIKFFGIFKQLRHKVTINIVRQLYHAFIYSKIKYGLEVYGNTSSRNISKLQVMQNELLKYVMRFDIRTGTNLLHTTLDIMKVEDIHKNNVLTFVNMCLMGKCPEIFNQYYRVKTTPYETRQEGSLDMPSHRIEYGARSVKVVGVKLRNRLEKDLEKYILKPCSKWKIRKSYISKYMHCKYVIHNIIRTMLDVIKQTINVKLINVLNQCL